MHPRTAIREKIVSLLLGNTIAGANVFGTMVDGLTAEQVPGIVVKARKDNVRQLLGEEPVQYQRTLLVKIGIATAGDEDIANSLCDEVELLLLKDYRLSGLATSVKLVETDLEPDSTGEITYWDGMILINVDYISTHS